MKLEDLPVTPYEQIKADKINSNRKSGVEWQVCSLELAKRLKELGCKQESLFHWHYLEEGLKICASPFRDEEEKKGGWTFSAFTVAELGQILATCRFRSDLHELSVGFNHTGTWENYWAILKYDSHEDKVITADTEADARAKMLCYLLENKILTL